jgi:hypothetical protein
MRRQRESSRELTKKGGKSGNVKSFLFILKVYGAESSPFYD